MFMQLFTVWADPSLFDNGHGPEALLLTGCVGEPDVAAGHLLAKRGPLPASTIFEIGSRRLAFK